MASVCNNEIRMSEATETLKGYEELFVNRFTSEDQEYQEYLNRPADPPPIVEDWRGRAGGNQRGRDNRYNDRRGHGDRGWRGHQGWHRDNRRQHHWQDRDRGWGHGSQYNQGSNSYQERQHYDRY
uniref:RNA guanine-7 methyltransferase activating subunit n=1 Tax=Oryzias sinensis TaxID=183150 RepID=A0A8C7XF73_9TELE